MKTSRVILNASLLPLLVAGAIGIAVVLVRTREQPQTAPPPRPVPSVEVTRVSPREIVPDIATFGVTRAYLRTELSPQVAGEIIEIGPNFDAGRTVTKGELLARIDPTDARALLAERQGALATAESTLADEETRSTIAAEDWTASGRKRSEASDFTLRKPQLEAARAQVDSARHAVDKALADLQRTELRAPYDAIVTSRDTSPGNQANVGTVIGELVSDERLEIELPLSPRQLQLLDPGDLHGGRIQASFRSPTHPDLRWHGPIRRVHPEVDESNRTVRVIAEIEGPFPSEESAGFVGTFLNARIPSRPLPDVLELEESQVVADSFLWTVTPESTLQPRPVEIVHSADGRILARLTDAHGSAPLAVVKRPLPSFEEGMPVVVADPLPPATQTPEEAPGS